MVLSSCKWQEGSRSFGSRVTNIHDEGDSYNK